MKVVAQVKFNSEKPRIESFGNHRYLVYLKYGKDDENAMHEFVNVMSKELGVPANRIRYIGKQGESYVFEVD